MKLIRITNLWEEDLVKHQGTQLVGCSAHAYQSRHLIKFGKTKVQKQIIHECKYTYKVVRDDKFSKESGSCPPKLLWDRSLHRRISYPSKTVTGKPIIRKFLQIGETS